MTCLSYLYSLQVDPNFWKDPNNQRYFLETVGKSLGVSELGDWYTIESSAISHLGSFGQSFFILFFSQEERNYLRNTKILCQRLYKCCTRTFRGIYPNFLLI